VLVGCLTFTEYGETLILKIIAWIGVGMMSLCIVASRKHYSVDVVVAWYTVPLVFYAMMRRWTTVRPVHEQWPHRPLIGEELGVAVKEENGDVSPSDKPLLPVVTVPAHHARQGSKGEAKGKPAGMRIPRRPSGSSLSLRELEMQEMENGSASVERNSDKEGSANVSSSAICRIS